MINVLSLHVWKRAVVSFLSTTTIAAYLTQHNVFSVHLPRKHFEGPCLTSEDDLEVLVCGFVAVTADNSC